MIRGILLISIVLFCASCSRKQQTLVAYEVTGAYGKSIFPDDRSIIIWDARQQIPPIIRKCGVVAFRDVPTSEYVFTFWFELNSEQQERIIPCLRQHLPKGAAIKKSNMPVGSL